MTQYNKNRFAKNVILETSSRQWLQNQWPPSLEENTALDLGCGSGFDMYEILKRSGRAWGMDNSKRMVCATRQKLLGFSEEKWVVIEHDMAKLSEASLPESSFDLVTARHSMQHLEHNNGDIRKLYQSIATILKPGGLFTFVVTHPLHYTDEYGKGLCDFSIYSGVTVTAQAHKLTDYLSSTFLSLFRLLAIEEGVAEEAQPFNGSPTRWLGISAKKL